jgi:hypothetical protein
MHQPIAPAVGFAGPRGRLLASIIGLALLAGAVAVRPPATLAFGGDGLRAAANVERTAGGLEPVYGTPLLDDIASHRASQLVKIDRLEHDIDYVTNRLNKAGVCWKGVGEIIAWERGYPDYDYDRVIQAWMDSSTHREILMGDAYNAAGGAWRTGDDGAHYSVMVFVVLCGASTSQVNVSLLRPERVYDPDRSLVLKRGWHTGYRLAANGSVLAKKDVHYDDKTFRRSAGRTVVNGVAWLKVSTGALDNYWVREAPRQHVRGMTALNEFATLRWASVDAGKYHGYHFDWLGRVVWSRTSYYRSHTNHRITARAIINGRPYVKFANGWLGGFWVRDTADISLK